MHSYWRAANDPVVPETHSHMGTVTVQAVVAPYATGITKSFVTVLQSVYPNWASMWNASDFKRAIDI